MIALLLAASALLVHGDRISRPHAPVAANVSGGKQLSVVLLSLQSKVREARPDDPALLSRAKKLHAASGTADAAVNLLNSELLELEEQIDASFFECQSHKQLLDTRSLELESAVARATAEMASLESQMASYSGELVPTSNAVDEMREKLSRLHKTCHTEMASLLHRRDLAASQLRTTAAAASKPPKGCSALMFEQQDEEPVAKLGNLRSIRQVEADEERPEAPAEALALLETMSQTMSQMHWAPEPLPPAALRPEPPPTDGAGAEEGGEAAATVKDKADMSCAELKGALVSFRDAAADRYAAAVAALSAHEGNCTKQADDLNAQLRHNVRHLARSQSLLETSVAARAELLAQVRARTEETTELKKQSVERTTHCTQTSTMLEREACNVVQTRQAIVWKFNGGDTGTVVQDCIVGDWTTGVCSRACLGPDGNTGVQTMTRTIVQEAGAGGAKCPPIKKVMPCNNVPCPVDCKMNQWSEWAECSRRCGGGSQYRTRSVFTPAQHRGAGCPSAVESRACNLQACRQPCTLDEWTGWSPCSRRCRVSTMSLPGHSFRTRQILVSPTNGGDCPESDRLEYRVCNRDICPTDVNLLKCTANQDVVALLDGSGTIGSAGFDAQKAFLKEVLKNSVLSGDDGAKEGLRYGFVVSGGTGKPAILSALSGVRSGLESSLDGASWPKGEEPVAWGLQAAVESFRQPGPLAPPRHGTVLLLLHEPLEHPRMTLFSATHLKDTGLRIVVVLMGTSAAGSAMDEFFCGMASEPCGDNVLRVTAGADLVKQMPRFLSVICPVSFSGSLLPE